MKKSKYGNKKVTVDGIKFDSKMESDYYKHLNKLVASGEVMRFVTQPKYILIDKFKKNGKTWRETSYVADFEVFYSNGIVEVVDVKGFVTSDFAIKRKLFESRYIDKELKVVTYSGIDNGWIELDQLKKNRRKRKVAKHAVNERAKKTNNDKNRCVS